MSTLIGLAALCISSVLPAAEHEASPSGSIGSSSVSPRKASDNPSGGTPGLFGKPVVFRGTLGGLPVQVSVRPKEIAEEGLEGEYFVFGRSQKILLAGELDADNFFLEESENGTSISGQWDGKLQGDMIRGDWMSADGAVSKPFSLKLIRSHAGLQAPEPVRNAPAASNLHP